MPSCVEVADLVAMVVGDLPIRRTVGDGAKARHVRKGVDSARAATAAVKDNRSRVLIIVEDVKELEVAHFLGILFFVPGIFLAKGHSLCFELGAK